MLSVYLSAHLCTIRLPFCSPLCYPFTFLLTFVLSVYLSAHHCAIRLPFCSPLCYPFTFLLTFVLSVYLSALRLGPAELRAVCEGLMHPLNSLRREQAFLSLSPLPHSHSYPIDLSSSTPKYNASAIIYLSFFAFSKLWPDYFLFAQFDHF